ncbi:MAG TPA: succinate dehydrogenase [Candidatus Angelobacter sp.]|nr:succinate dehydrogenase [Candidatus Angelobacter sp.]
MAERSSAVPGGLGRTLRRDAWWMENIPVIILLGGFGLYATLRAFEGKFFEVGPYLSPFYSPLIDASHHWWRFSPALLILAFPLGFRVTCYYYRKAYYRAFFLDPPGCAVGEPAHRNYRGETGFPFVLQNLHRYFLYGAIVFLGFLWYDAIRAFWFPGLDQKLHFGIGVGTLILLVNIILLTLYLLSCHSLRHLIGGKIDCFSCSAFNLKRHSTWKKATFLNERHMLFAWCSLISVGFADFYVRMVASGMIKDFRIL